MGVSPVRGDIWAPESSDWAVGVVDGDMVSPVSRRNPAAVSHSEGDCAEVPAKKGWAAESTRRLLDMEKNSRFRNGSESIATVHATSIMKW
jgi:hypothetical protein